MYGNGHFKIYASSFNKIPMFLPSIEYIKFNILG